MVREFSNPPYLEWLQHNIGWYFAVVGILSLAALVIAAVILVARYGPHPAGDMIYRLIVSAATDLVRFSPRRVFALARLAVQESMRRRVWVALVVFAVILMFAGWFLNPTTSDQTQIDSFQTAKLYINFVLTATTYLVMLLALFLSAFSLPADIKSRTIFTVVTKPVRTGEIVLGRMLGFTAIGTALLVIMGLASYVFVTRTLSHTHELTAADLVDLPTEPGATAGGKEGKTSIEHGHSHHVTLGADGNGVTDVVQGHYHHIQAEKDGDKVRYVVGPPEDELIARVPIYVDADDTTTFSFLDRSGKSTPIGINVGKEWTYRSFLDGGTPMAAIWRFKGITKQQFPDGRLPLEMYLRVFRTYKGEIADEKHRNRAVGIPASIMLRNPQQPSIKSIAMPFEALDQMIDKRMVLGPVLEREVDGQYESIGLFKNTPGTARPELSLVDDKGEIEVVLQCLAPSQYIGVARDDIYLKAAESSFAWNFCKGYFGVWIQMVVIVAFGVAFSTFLSGPVAMLGTLASLVLGFFTADISALFLAVIQHDYKKVPGGGPIESLIRILGQKTITLELEPSLGVQVAQFFDKVIMTFMKAVVDVLPNFNDFSNVQFVAEGFDIPWNRLLEQATTGLGFVVALFLVGHVFLRMRELGK